MISDTNIWILHMSAITCRSSLLKLFAHPTHTHQFHPMAVSICGAGLVAPSCCQTSIWEINCNIYMIHSDTFKYQTILYLLQGVSFWNWSNLHICCKSPQVLEEGLQREMMRNAPLSTLRHKCLNPSVFQYLWLMTVSKFSTLWKYTRVKAPIGRVHVYSFLWHRNCHHVLGKPLPVFQETCYRCAW